MANRLEMAMIQAILQLRAAGLSRRAIARKLGVHRETVARLLQQSQPVPKPANAPSGSESSKPANFQSAPGQEPLGTPQAAVPSNDPAATAISKPAKAPSGSVLGTCTITGTTGPASETGTTDRGSPSHDTINPGRSVCEQFRDLIRAMLEEELSAQRIYQDLCAQHGYAGSYYSVRRFVHKLTAQLPLPMRRMECTPGFEAQVDYGKGAPIVTAEGKRRKTHVFRIVLSHSRKAYSEASFRQTTEDFLRCLENAFAHFGGVPQTLVIDNLRAAVSHPDWYDPELTPKVRSFCEHYHTAILPTRPYTPRHKGKIERGVGYVKSNSLKGRTFQTLAEQNEHLANWEQSVADTRIHGTTRRHVGQLFAEVERRELQSLPTDRFPFFHEAERCVHRDGHVEVAKAYYSVPPEYLGRKVWVRWDERVVHVFNQRMEQIAMHVRNEMGRFHTLPAHIAPEKINGVERGTKWLMDKVSLIGPDTTAWAEAMLVARGIQGIRVLLGVIALTRKHPSEKIERACQAALSCGAFHLRVVRALALRQPEIVQQALPFLEEHPLIRPLDDYARVVAAALERNADRVTSQVTPRGHATVRLTRHDRAIECPPQQQNPGGDNHQGPRDIHPPGSGYSSPGCSPAEPGSASPDNSSLRPLPPPLPGESSDE